MENLIKYPRTFHMPGSPGAKSDDKVLKNMSFFHGKEIVLTLKTDGECTSLTTDRCWPRSLDSRHHESRSWVKQFWAQIRRDIPADLRICGENVYAQHSIEYQALPSFFLGFNAWRGSHCLPWDETQDIFECLGITSVPVLYRGIYDENRVLSEAKGPDLLGGIREGAVGRLVTGFNHEDFKTHVFKWVRPDHVQTDEHWMSKPVVPNKLL